MTEDGTLAVSWEALFTVVDTVVPLKTATDEETNWLPVSTKERLDGSWENTTFAGETEVSTGAGRALPQNGFKAPHPNRNVRRTTKGPKRRAGDML